MEYWSYTVISEETQASEFIVTVFHTCLICKFIKLEEIAFLNKLNSIFFGFSEILCIFILLAKE